MIFPRIVIVVFILFCALSCKDSFGKKHDAEQNKTKAPAIEYQEKSHPKTDRKIPSEESSDKELKKKKLKAIDTLKPVVAIP